MALIDITVLFFLYILKHFILPAKKVAEPLSSGIAEMAYFFSTYHFFFEKETQKGKMKNTKAQKSKRCENVEYKRCKNVEYKRCENVKSIRFENVKSKKM